MPGKRRILTITASSLLMAAAPYLLAAQSAWECRAAADGQGWECFNEGVLVVPEPTSTPTPTSTEAEVPEIQAAPARELPVSPLPVKEEVLVEEVAAGAPEQPAAPPDVPVEAITPATGESALPASAGDEVEEGASDESEPIPLHESSSGPTVTPATEETAVASEVPDVVKERASGESESISLHESSSGSEAFSGSTDAPVEAIISTADEPVSLSNAVSEEVVQEEVESEALSKREPATLSAESGSSSERAEAALEKMEPGGVRIDRGLDWSQCGPAPATERWIRSEAPATPVDDRTHISADSAEISHREEVGTFSGNVEVRRGAQRMEADEIRYNNIDDILDARGGVYYQHPGIRLTGSHATFNLTATQGQMENVEYRLPQRGARGNAARAEIKDRDRSHFQEITYTTCRPGDESWLFQAESLDIDQAQGRGEVRNAKLRFKGVPLLYLPYVSFPIDNRRKSGVLTPSVGQTGETGFDLAVPYYLNLAPNYDATLVPRIMSKRGLMLGGEFRYLTSNHQGQLSAEILPQDDAREPGKNKARGAFSFQERGKLAPRWDLDVNLNYVSDVDYLSDFSSGLSLASSRQQERRGDLRYHGDFWSFLGRVQYFQTVDETLAATDRPFQRLPQLLLQLERPEQAFGLTYHLRSEYVRFDRDSGVTGHRLDLNPAVSLPLRRTWGYLTPKVGARYTGYRLSGEAVGSPDSPSRFLPTLSIDGGLFFERRASWFGRSAMQTLEPRIFYLLTPGKNQDDLPVFDSSGIDFSFSSLFRENRFNGADRIGDANQLTLALTSRTLAEPGGKEFLRASLGQIFYFADRNVQLPGVNRQDDSSSAIVGEVTTRLTERLSARAGLQWNPHGGGGQKTEKSALQLHYQDGRRRIFNLAYRFTRDLVEQTDISTRWPVTTHLSAVARWNYSLRHNRTMEGFGGAEYGGCCWAVRAVIRRYVNGANESANTAFFLQLELKGLSRFGSDINSLLDRGIFGYKQGG